MKTTLIKIFFAFYLFSSLFLGAEETPLAPRSQIEFLSADENFSSRVRGTPFSADRMNLAPRSQIVSLSQLNRNSGALLKNYFDFISKLKAFHSFKDEKETLTFLFGMNNWFGTNELITGYKEHLEGKNGVYIGVGYGGQNFSKLCHGNFQEAIIIDLNPFVTEVYMPMRALLISRCETRAEYLSTTYGIRLDEKTSHELKNASLEKIDEVLSSKKDLRDTAFIEETGKEIIALFPDSLKAQAEKLWNKYAYTPAIYRGIVRSMKQEESWLQNEESYAKIRNMILQNKIKGITGNWLSKEFTDKISSYIHGQKKETSVVYISNITEWIKRNTLHANEQLSFLFSNIQSFRLKKDSLIIGNENSKYFMMNTDDLKTFMSRLSDILQGSQTLINRAS